MRKKQNIASDGGHNFSYNHTESSNQQIVSEISQLGQATFLISQASLGPLYVNQDDSPEMNVNEYIASMKRKREDDVRPTEGKRNRNARDQTDCDYLDDLFEM